MPSFKPKSSRRRALRAPYEVIRVVSGAGRVVRVQSDDFGYQLWYRHVKRVCVAPCRNCKIKIEVGSTCYSERTRLFKNRTHRICARCVSGQILRGLPRVRLPS